MDGLEKEQQERLKGFRVSLAVERYLSSLDKQKKELFFAKGIEMLKERGVVFITKNVVESIIEELSLQKELEKAKEKVKEKKEEKKEKSIVVKRSLGKPIAAEYESSIKPKHEEDVTGKSRTQGTVKDFVNYFRNRFYSFRAMFRMSLKGYDEIKVEDLKKSDGEKVKVYCMIYEKSISRNGNLLLRIEDLTGMGVAVVPKSSEKFEQAKELIEDEVVMLYGVVRRGLLIVEDFDEPELPRREFPVVEKDLAILYLSDLHFGSVYFMQKLFDRFLRWIKREEGNQRARKLAEKVKYIIVAGDIVDGVGIYPGQEKELIVKDIFKQYSLFDRFVESLPSYIDVIIIPGNHDAVRRAEPMPALSKDLIASDVVSLGNPAVVDIEEVRHLLYHGTSMDSIIASIPRLNYTNIRDVMAFLLKKRHLSPIYGTNPIVPEKIDYLLIRSVPNIVHMGHLHRYAKGLYKGIALINSATFQAQTEYQLKQGHIPTPGIVPVLELKHSSLSLLDFNSPALFCNNC